MAEPNASQRAYLQDLMRRSLEMVLFICHIDFMRWVGGIFPRPTLPTTWDRYFGLVSHLSHRFGLWAMMDLASRSREHILANFKNHWPAVPVMVYADHMIPKFSSRILPAFLLLSALSMPMTSLADTLGYGETKYSVDMAWAKVDPAVAPVINAHALAEGRDGLMYVVTDHPKNAFLVFKKDGTYVRSFGAGLLGGHGLEIFEKDGEEYLLHVDCGWHFAAEGWNPTPGDGRVAILKMDGTVVRQLPRPAEMGWKDGKFMPCDVAVTPQGNILIADGYASNFVYEVTFTGEPVRKWGGPAKGKDGHLSNAHGISLDLSDPQKPLAWVPSRDECKLKAFTLQGEYVESIDLPGAYAGQMVFAGDKIYTAVCWSKEGGAGKRLPESGFVLVLDRKTKKVINSLGGSEPKYDSAGKLEPMHQTTAVFKHCHDLAVDRDGAIYVGEWNAARRFPGKLTPVKPGK